MNRNAKLTRTSLLSMREDFHQEDGHSSDLDQKRSGMLLMKSKPQGEWDRVAELMMINFSESGHPVFRSTSPLSRGVLKSKGGGKLSIHCCADPGTIETVFRTIIFVLISSVFTEQSQICVKHTNPAMLEQGDVFW